MTLPTLTSTVILSLNGRRLGTGFLLSDRGLLATCFHIVKKDRNSREAAVDLVLDFEVLITENKEGGT